MKMLFSETHTQTDTYHFEINGGGEFYVKESGKVTIVFENKIFVSASYPFGGTYTRNGWRILAAINEKINEIEQALKGGGQAEGKGDLTADTTNGAMSGKDS